MKKASIALVLATGITALIANSVAASTIDFLGDGKSAQVTIHSPVLGNLTANAGELDWKWEGVAPINGYAPNSSFFAYCVDANNFITNTEQVTVKDSSTLTTATGTDAGGKAAWLFDNFANSVHASGTNEDAAALQVAIWAAMYNPSNSVTSGPFQLLSGGNIQTKAQNYLSALYTGPNGYQTSQALWLDAPAGAGQDQMLGSVPEPASLVLLGSGLVGVGRLIRRKRRTAKA